MQLIWKSMEIMFNHSIKNIRLMLKFNTDSFDLFDLFIIIDVRFVFSGTLLIK